MACDDTVSIQILKLIPIHGFHKFPGQHQSGRYIHTVASPVSTLQYQVLTLQPMAQKQGQPRRCPAR